MPSDDNDEPLLAPGSIVANRYRVGAPIGSGGTAIVYEAEDVQTRRVFAIKVVHQGRSEPASKTEPMMLEAQVAMRLTSPHAVRLFEVGTLLDGRPFLVMERLSGQDLGRRLLERGPMSVMDACDLVLQACHALAESHRMGVVHRDLKPANLFVSARRDGSPHVKVLDFGLASMMASELDALAVTSSTSMWRVAGSAGYAAPEQIGSKRNIDARADIWGLGVVLHELVLGRRPFEAANLVDSLIAAGSLPLAPMGPVPPDFEALVRRCLEKDREQRFPDIATLAEALSPLAPATLADYPDFVRQVAGNVPPNAESTQRMAVEEDAPSSLGPSRVNPMMDAPRSSGVGPPSSSVARVIPAELPRWGGLVGIAAISAIMLWVLVAHTRAAPALPPRVTAQALVGPIGSSSMLLPPLARTGQPASAASATGVASPGDPEPPSSWHEVP